MTLPPEESLFTGPVEHYLLQKLKKDGRISATYLLSVYTSIEGAKAFVNKLIVLKLGERDKEGNIRYIGRGEEVGE